MVPVVVALVRVYLGWAYVGDRLLSAVVEYEETGWRVHCRPLATPRQRRPGSSCAARKDTRSPRLLRRGIPPARPPTMHPWQLTRQLKRRDCVCAVDNRSVCRYDGQTWVKPPKVLARDRLLGSYEVRSISRASDALRRGCDCIGCVPGSRRGLQ